MTTIKSTELDFQVIRNNLKTFLQEKDEFRDYNFEASGLSNILDVLAYSIHYDALTANMALNESYLNSAQLRSSIVSIAESMGYVPGSKTSSSASVTLSTNLSSLANQPATIELPINSPFNAVVDDITYRFVTREALFASNDNGVYTFANASGSTNVLIYEGTVKTRTFIVGSQADAEVYVIPDEALDISTVIVRVYDTIDSSSFVEYENVFKASSINENSTLYNIKEAPNGYYEINFGDGNALGQLPTAGQRIEVEYVAATGADANGAEVFSSVNGITVNNQTFNLSTVTVSPSAGGSDKEGIESIRRNAPFRYATQNRMVTANDYSQLILREFGSNIKDIISWGGEDAIVPEFGVTFVSILFNEDVSSETISSIQNQITDLAESFAVITFDVRFTDPDTTFLAITTEFSFDPNLTTASLASVESEVRAVIDSYTDTETERFSGAFRRSNMLTLVDDVSPSVLSSSATLTMSKEYVPSLSRLNTFTLRFPVGITASVVSDTYLQNGVRVYVSSTTDGKLQVKRRSDDVVLKDVVGSYDQLTGEIRLEGLDVDAFVEGSTAIRFYATPANQAAIVTSRNDVLEYDETRSRVTGTVV